MLGEMEKQFRADVNCKHLRKGQGSHLCGWKGQGSYLCGWRGLKGVTFADGGGCRDAWEIQDVASRQLTQEFPEMKVSSPQFLLVVFVLLLVFLQRLRTRMFIAQTRGGGF